MVGCWKRRGKGEESKARLEEDGGREEEKGEVSKARLKEDGGRGGVK